MSTTVYIGVDPGVNGGCAAINHHGTCIAILKHAGTTEHQQWEWVSQWVGTDAVAMIEQQTARPSRIPDHEAKKRTGKMEWRTTVLASTVTLYGSYRDLWTMLLCSGIDYQDCPPKRWQAGLGIPSKEKASDTVWKNRLKSVAQGLFPDVKVTLWSADALLLAEYNRRCRIPIIKEL